MRSGFMGTSQPVVVADDDRRVLFISARGADLLETQDDLSVEGGYLGASEPAIDAGLRRAFAALRQAHEWGEIVGVVPLRRRQRLPLVGYVIVIPWLDEGETASLRSAAMLLCYDPLAPCTAGAFGRHLSLTAAEIRLVELILQGNSLSEACDRLSITPNTGRTHLKAIFAKTGARSQSDLIRLFCVNLQQFPIAQSLLESDRAELLPRRAEITHSTG
jgi:DNA-binding CsgD family transcriptional regulator